MEGPPPGPAGYDSHLRQATCMRPETTITCIDCGGVAHLLTTWPEDDPPQPGDIMTYRCADCMDRWDLELPDDGDEDEGFSS